MGDGDAGAPAAAAAAAGGGAAGKAYTDGCPGASAGGDAPACQSAGNGGFGDGFSGGIVNVTKVVVTSGDGGQAGYVYPGGGGAGGLNFADLVVSGEKGSEWYSGKGGKGAGAGGGGGGMTSTSYGAGGRGAHGLVYIEW